MTRTPSSSGSAEVPRVAHRPTVQATWSARAAVPTAADLPRPAGPGPPDPGPQGAGPDPTLRTSPWRRSGGGRGHLGRRLPGDRPGSDRPGPGLRPAPAACRADRRRSAPGGHDDRRAGAPAGPVPPPSWHRPGATYGDAAGSAERESWRVDESGRLRRPPRPRARSRSSRSSTPVVAWSAAATSAGRRSRPWASSTGNRSMASCCSSPGRHSRTPCSRRSGGRTGSATWAGRSSGGSGPTCSSPRHWSTGSTAPSPAVGAAERLRASSSTSRPMQRSRGRASGAKTGQAEAPV